MRKIEWEKLPKPLRLLLVPLTLSLAMLGWVMMVVGEQKEDRQRRIERTAPHSQ